MKKINRRREGGGHRSMSTHLNTPQLSVYFQIGPNGLLFSGKVIGLHVIMCVYIICLLFQFMSPIGSCQLDPQ